MTSESCKTHHNSYMQKKYALVFLKSLYLMSLFYAANLFSMRNPVTTLLEYAVKGAEVTVYQLIIPMNIQFTFEIMQETLSYKDIF